MFGVTMIKVKAKNAYTIEELYERIKDVPFDAGVPQLCRYMTAQAICFPEQDRNNQVQISVNRKGQITVMRSPQPMSVEKVAVNLALDHLTDGMSSMSMLFGKKKKLCEALTRRTAEQLSQMGL